MIFVSAVVVMAMSAMFVACSENAPANGCTCTENYKGESETFTMPLEEMKNYGYKTCSDIVADFNKYTQGASDGATMTCKGY